MMRGRAFAIFLLLALTYAQFFQAATWGSACRLDLARALVERGTVRIDDYQANTGDKALVTGHYYSDKGPLTSLLATPGVALAHGLRDVTGRPHSDALWLTLLGGLATFFASGLPSAAAGALLYRVLADRGAAPRTAAWATLLAFLATTLFPYATLLQGHALLAAWVLLFFHATFPANGPPSARLSLLAGVAASGAVATEILAVPALVILGAASLLRHRPVALRHAALLAVGAAPGLALLAYYQQVAFGSPLSFGYQYVALPFFQEKMSQGFFGIGAPRPRVALELLFGSYRGLFFACPVLLAAVAGLVSLVRDPSRRIESVAALAVLGAYLALNAGYSTWSGGWAIGPRHLVVAVPLLALGLPHALARFPRATFTLGAVSLLFMLAATSVQPEVPEDIGNPLFDHVLPHFVHGELGIGEQGFADLYPTRTEPDVPEKDDAFLLGELLHLRGLAALLPVFCVWGLLGRRALAK